MSYTQSVAPFNYHGLSGAMEARQKKFSHATNGIYTYINACIMDTEPTSFKMENKIVDGASSANIAIVFKDDDGRSKQAEIIITTAGRIQFFGKDGNAHGLIEENKEQFYADDRLDEPDLITKIIAMIRQDEEGVFRNLPLDLDQGYNALEYDNRSEAVQKAQDRLNPPTRK